MAFIKFHNRCLLYNFSYVKYFCQNLNLMVKVLLDVVFFYFHVLKRYRDNDLWHVSNRVSHIQCSSSNHTIHPSVPSASACAIPPPTLPFHFPLWQSWCYGLVLRLCWLWPFVISLFFLFCHISERTFSICPSPSLLLLSTLSSPHPSM